MHVFLQIILLILLKSGLKVFLSSEIPKNIEEVSKDGFIEISMPKNFIFMSSLLLAISFLVLLIAITEINFISNKTALILSLILFFLGLIGLAISKFHKTRFNSDIIEIFSATNKQVTFNWQEIKHAKKNDSIGYISLTTIDDKTVTLSSEMNGAQFLIDLINKKNLFLK